VIEIGVYRLVRTLVAHFTGRYTVTRYGYQVHQWLVERGWRDATETNAALAAEFRCGDPMLLDKDGDTPLGPYAALDIHLERTGDCPEFLRKDPDFETVWKPKNFDQHSKG
jgi:hypothetical protein